MLELMLMAERYRGRVDATYEWGSDASVIVILDSTSLDLLQQVAVDLDKCEVASIWFQTRTADVSASTFQRRRLLARYRDPRPA